MNVINCIVRKPASSLLLPITPNAMVPHWRCCRTNSSMMSQPLYPWFYCNGNCTLLTFANLWTISSFTSNSIRKVLSIVIYKGVKQVKGILLLIVHFSWQIWNITDFFWFPHLRRWIHLSWSSPSCVYHTLFDHLVAKFRDFCKPYFELISEILSSISIKLST